MDKTGTVTFGTPRVTDVVTLDGLSDTELVKYAASLEKNSEHPIASAILSHASAQQVTVPDPERFEYLVGQGLRGIVAGQAVVLVNAKFLADQGIPLTPQTQATAYALGRDGKSALFLAVDGVVEGVIAVADVIRDEAPAALEALKKLGVRRLILLTGDNERVAAAIAARLGIAEYRANQLPDVLVSLNSARLLKIPNHD